MTSSLSEQLESLDGAARELLAKYHFDPKLFQRLAQGLAQGNASSSRIAGVTVTAPNVEDIPSFPAPGSGEYARCEALGLAALASGRCALLVMAGGMATRMGGVTKALVEAIPGYTFLDLRLREVEAVEKRVGVAPPLWLMSSHSTDAALREYLGARLDGERVGIFSQNLSLALTPNGQVFKDAAGQPVVRAPGHGDLPEALQRSGLLDAFIERGGLLVMVANVDNLGATLEPALLGWHLTHRSPATLEVVEKVDKDRGGIPVRVDNELIALEEFCLPEDFAPETVRVFSTNTFIFDAKALRDLRIPWTYHRVEKTFGTEKVIQFERLLNEVTHHLRTRYLRVPRHGKHARFLPIKDLDELEVRRPEIEETLKSRGIIS